VLPTALKTKLVGNTIFALLSNGLRIGTNFIVFILIARHESIENFGKFTVAFSFAMFFLCIANYGFERTSVIQISKHKKNILSYVNTALASKLIISILTYLLMLISASVFIDDLITRHLIYILTISVITTSYITLFNSIYRSVEAIKYEFNVAIINNSALIVFSALVTQLHLGIIALGYAFVAARLLSVIFTIHTFKKRIGSISVDINLESTKKILLTSSPLAALSFMTAILFGIDSVIISKILDYHAAGIYQPGVRIITALTVIPFIIESSFFPVLCNSSSCDMNYRKMAKKYNLFLLGSGILIASILYLFSEIIITHLFGPKFPQLSIQILQGLCIVLVLRFIIRSHELILVSLSQLRPLLIIFAVGLILHVILNVTLIHFAGVMGSVYAAMISNLVIAMLLILHLLNKSRIFLFW